MGPTRMDETAEAPPVVSGRLDEATAVGWVTLDRPERMNAVTVALAEQLADMVEDLAGRSRVLVLRGAGGHFCTGGDFQEVQRLQAEGTGALRSLFDAFGRACSLVGEVEVPVIAAVQGNAMAGGFELAQACDVVLVADDAVLCDNHVNHGMVPGGGGSQRLPRLVGRGRALGHMLSGEPLSGREAVAWGLAYRHYPPDEFLAGVEAFAATMARRAPAALARIKRLVRDGLEQQLEDGLEMERKAVVHHLATRSEQ